MSALDQENEREIQKSLEALMASRIVLMISHRWSSLQLCDEVAVLDAGHVTYRGPPANLAQALRDNGAEWLDRSIAG